MLAGLMAAALSSATTFLSLVGFSVSHDIVPNRKKSDSSMLRFSRLMILAVGAVILTISLSVPQEIWWITNFVGPVFASSWGPVAFMSVWSDRITSNAAFWGIVAGFIGNVAPKFCETIGWITLPSYAHPVLIGGAIGLLVILWVSSRGKVTEGERAYRLKLHDQSEEEQDARQTKITGWVSMILAGFGVITSVGFFVFYVMPYQTITGTHLTDGGFNWFSGEALHAIGWAAVCIPFAVLAYRVVHRSYGAPAVEETVDPDPAEVTRDEVRG